MQVNMQRPDGSCTYLSEALSSPIMTLTSRNTARSRFWIPDSRFKNSRLVPRKLPSGNRTVVEVFPDTCDETGGLFVWATFGRSM